MTVGTLGGYTIEFAGNCMFSLDSIEAFFTDNSSSYYSDPQVLKGQSLEHVEYLKTTYDGYYGELNVLATGTYTTTYNPPTKSINEVYRYLIRYLIPTSDLYINSIYFGPGGIN